MASSRSLIRSLSYWSFVALLCGLVTEVSVRVWGLMPPYDLQAQGIQYPLTFALDPNILYRFLPNPQRAINRLGFRDADFGAKDPSRQRVVVVGDSFPMGLFVAPNETFPKRLQALVPKSEVLNLGVQGYGPDQELIALSVCAPSLRPDVIVWSLFPSNDLNDLIKNRLFEVASDGSLRRTTSNPVTEALPMLRTSMLVRFFLTGRFLKPEVEEALQPVLFTDHEAPQPVTPKTMEIMGAVVRHVKQLAHSLRAPLIALIIPSYEQAQPNSSVSQSLNDDSAAILANEGIETINLSRRFQNHPELYTEEEHHLSRAGHVAVAEALARATPFLP